MMSVGVLMLASCGQTKEKLIATGIEMINKQYPVQVDANTRMDSLIYNSGAQTVTFYASVTGNADNADVFAQMGDQLTTVMVEAVKNDNTLKLFKDNDLNIAYIYSSDSSKNELLKVLVTPEMYK